MVSYGGHTMPSTMLGFPPRSILPVCSATPALLVVGEADGVIAASADRYADAESSAHNPVAMTFDLGISRASGDCYELVLKGGTHTSVQFPEDATTARGFLDPPGTAEPAVRSIFSALSIAFLDLVVRTDQDAAGRLSNLLLADQILSARCK